MAVKIESQNCANDVFKVTCPSCGRALSYERRDVKSHRRWPNGYIYCPGCKAPIGHNEANLFKTGDEIDSERIVKEERKQREIERRKNYLSDNERLKNDAEKYEQNKRGFLKAGIPILVFSTLLMIAVIILLIVKPFKGIDAISSAAASVLIPLICLGIFLIIMWSIYNTKAKNLKAQIKKNEQNEKDSN